MKNINRTPKEILALMQNYPPFAGMFDLLKNPPKIGSKQDVLSVMAHLKSIKDNMRGK